WRSDGPCGIRKGTLKLRADTVLADYDPGTCLIALDVESEVSTLIARLPYETNVSSISVLPPDSQGHRRYGINLSAAGASRSLEIEAADPGDFTIVANTGASGPSPVFPGRQYGLPLKQTWPLPIRTFRATVGKSGRLIAAIDDREEEAKSSLKITT